MNAKIYVTLKNGVLDPQGKTIHKAVENIGYKGIVDVRQGKVFEIKVNNGFSKSDAQKLLEKLAQEILANPVIEHYRVEIE